MWQIIIKLFPFLFFNLKSTFQPNSFSGYKLALSIYLSSILYLSICIYLAILHLHILSLPSFALYFKTYQNQTFSEIKKYERFIHYFFWIVGFSITNLGHFLVQFIIFWSFKIKVVK